MKKNIALSLISSMVISAFPAISFAAYDTNDDGNLTAVTYNYEG